MRKRWKRWLAGVMTAVMLIAALPTAAYAAVGDLLDMSSVQRTALLEALEDAYGEDAEAYLAILEQYGLVDEDGSFVTDEKIVMDGVEYTLDEIEATLNDPATDLSKVVEVDGTSLTLEELKTIVEIERYLAYLQATYFTEQELTDEQISSFYDLADAWANGNVQLLSANALDGVGPAGVDHDVRLEVTGDSSAEENSTYTVTVTPNKAQAKDITFTWRVLSGSAQAAGENVGTVTIPAGSADPVTLTVNVGDAAERTKGSSTFLVQFYDVENALFENGTTRHELTVTVAVQDDYYYYSAQSIIVSSDIDEYYANTEVAQSSYPNSEHYDPTLVNQIKSGNMIQRGTQSLSGVNALSDGEYIVEIAPQDTIEGPTVRRNDYTIYGNVSFWEYAQEKAVKQEIPLKVKFEFKLVERNTGNVIGAANILEAEGISLSQSGYIELSSLRQPITVRMTIDHSQNITYAYQAILESSGYYLELDDGANIAMYPYIGYMPSLCFYHAVQSAEVSFSAPAGTYYAGQYVPITADFGYPVKITRDMTITVNGQTLTPVETGTTSEKCTYLYPVDDTSGASLSITGTSFIGTEDDGIAIGANQLDLDLTEAADSPIQVGGGQAGGVTLESLDREQAFGEPQLSVTREENKTPVLTVTLPLKSKPYDDWVLNEVNSDTGELTALKVVTSQTGTEQYAFKVDNTQNPTTLTATIPLPNNTTTTELTGKVDFLLDGRVRMTQGREYTLEGSVPLTQDDYNRDLRTFTISYNDGTSISPSSSAYISGEEAAQIKDVIFDFVPGLKEGNFTWGDTSKVVIYNSIEEKPDNVTGEEYHFALVGSGTVLSGIKQNEDGTFSMMLNGGAVGHATITVYALNGDMEDAYLTSATIEVYNSGEAYAYLNIPESGLSVTARYGEAAKIYWNSNVCALNQAAGENGAFVPTTFTVQMCTTDAYGDEFKLPDAEDQDYITEFAKHFTVVKEYSVTTDEQNPLISSFSIPWDDLKTIYDGTTNNRKAVVFISTEYDGKLLGARRTEDTLEFEEGMSGAPWVIITLLPPPASVTLEKPADGLYQTDDGGNGKSITLNWTAKNLDAENGGKFELYIAGGDTPISETSLSENGVTKTGDDTYSYTLNVPEVEPDAGDPSSYRDAYTITVKVKNAADSAWAYDSYVLYVYSEDILDILLDHGETDTTGGTYKMSNVEKIKALWDDGGEDGSEAIVALQRDIALRNVISINYGQYAWAELADQIAWSSKKADGTSGSDIASVNYQQGTLYENIENFSYTTYRPSTDFVLSGLEDGSTTITAAHGKLPEISDSLTVDVETLRDKLYLFQCYPKAVTTLTYEVYTDESRTQTEQMTLNTNEKGEAAIYAEYGIAGDICCNSVADDGDDEDVVFLGVIRNQSLVSSEADSTKLQLYPVNTLRLRRAAQAEIYLKNPDGTPYVGQVTFRGGVYRQGEYCTGAAESVVTFGLQGEKDPNNWKPGNEPQTVSTDDEGRLLVNMDLEKFKTEDITKDVQAGEALYYLFQLEYGDGTGAECYPIFLRVNASLNLDDVAVSGDSIVVWEKNESGEKRPYIAQQTLSYSPKKYASVADIRKNTGNVGPSDTFPTAYVTTSVMWWGDDHAKDEGRANTVMLQDATGKTPACQTSETTTYPFTDLVFTENRMTMDANSMEKWGVGQGESRGMRAVLSEDGTTASRTISLPFKMVNMIGVPEAADSSTLTDAMKDIENGMDVDAGEDVGGMGDGDIMVEGGMDLLSDDASYDPGEDKFAVRLYATSDPMVFRALFGVNMGDLGPGVYPEYDDPENMTFVHGDASTSDNAELNALPGLSDLYSMAKGDYLSNAKQDAQMAKAGKGSLGTSMALGGYMEANISYNSATSKWECKPISGGFNVGAGVDYTWIFNSFVGIVPITASLTLGGALEIRMDMQQGNYYEVSSGMEALQNANDTAAFNAALEKASYDAATGNDYLTNLRIYFYMRAFAGIGFDYSVVAFKIGVFGQLNLDMQFEWLNRSYLDDDSKNISAVGQLSSRQDDVISGSNLSVSGSTGIEFVFKFLFISYEKIFCSIGFESVSDNPGWRTIEDIWKSNKTINGSVVTRMAMPDGQVMYAVDLGAQLESRDYVDAVEQEWLGGMPSIGLFSLDEDQDATLAEALQTGAYSYANPVLTDDGQVMFYLSDRGDGQYGDATDLANTRVAVSTKNETGQFQKGTRFDGNMSHTIDDDISQQIGEGYGDSGVKVAGSDGNYAAVWVRQTEDFTDSVIDPNAPLDGDLQMLQMNSTEIIVATPDSDATNGWSLTQLTDNSTPDLAPVVAASEERIIVAWREVKSSSAADLTSFDQQDAIRFAVCEKKNGTWEWQWEEEDVLLMTKGVVAQTLYDGTGSKASVKGLEMAMLEDGTAAVVYTLDTDSTNDSTTDWETVVAIIPAADGTYGADDAQSEDLVRTFRLTTDENLDENPQITTATIDGEERFVVAWHTERAITDADDGQTESDIRLVVMDANGNLYSNMPESLSIATGGTGDTIDANFRFAKNTGGIDDLAILWGDSVSAAADETSYESPQDAISYTSTNVGHDVLKAVKFVKNGDSYTLSGTVVVAEMQEGTLIDHFDAYVSDTSTHEIKSVILGTNYTETTTRQVTIADPDGKNEQTATITVANPISGMYTATEKFTNQIQESAVMLAYHELYTNSDIDVQFTIRNTGMDSISKLEIVSGDAPVYTSGETPLNLLPNRDITVTAKFPTGEAIENVNYTIKATFTDGTTAELPGTLYLDIPDVGISYVTTVKQADGERTLRYALHNRLSASLADEKDNWQVKVGFYADQNCTVPLKDGEGNALVSTITEQTDLALIDADGYSAEVTLPVASYMTGEDDVQEEIPSTGIPVYVKAWIEAPVEDPAMRARIGDHDSVSEYFTANNTTSLTLRSLAEERDEPVTVTYDMSVADGKTIVNTKVQYNYLGGTTSGNLIVTLLDAQGQPIAKQQSYTKDGGLLTLSKEGTANQTFTFDSDLNAADVRVEFSDLVLESSSTALHHITVGGHTAVFDPNTNTYTVNAIGLTSGILEIAPKDPQNATIKLDGQDYDVEASHTTQFASGTTTWNIAVSNGGNSASYTLKLTNNADSVPVTGVSLDQTSLTLAEGGTSQLTATVQPHDATNKNVRWTSSNDSVATVDANGNVNAVGVGTATITVTTADGGKTATCTVTVTSSGGSGSGGSGSSSYAVETDANTDHGTVTVKPSRAEKGDTVTITAKPDEGYQVGKITVTDKNGDPVKVTDKGNGKYTFTMPGSKVSVDVTFVPEKQWTNPFVDVPGDAWYYDAVKYVNENGLMAGTSANTFAPDLTTTRGMIVTILYRLAGSPDIEDEIWGYPFKDVDANAYYATAVYWARMNGIVAGYSDELFGPNDTITREQMATILYRYAQYKGYDTTAKADLSKYTDAAQIGSYAVDAIRWANAEGLVSGTSGTTLTPKGSATRSQVAVILMRFCQNIVK